jgi:L-iditol 2-dehydrogenase
MKAVVQTGIGRFEARDIPQPRPARGEVVLRVGAALTCGTDRKMLERGHAKFALPATMGHEACGEIVEIGEGVSGFDVGDRVVPGVSGPCGSCTDCRTGRANLCAKGFADRTWGAFAEFLRVPAGVVASNLHRPAPQLPDEIAAFLDPLASVIHGWSRLSVSEGRLLIYGSGGLALLWAATAPSHGMRAIVAGRKPERLNLAASSGADVLDLARYEPEDLFSRTGALPDAAVDCTGDPEVWMRLPNLVRHGGSVLLFGGCAPGASVSFDAGRLHYSEISLIGSFHYTPDEAREALESLRNGSVDPRPLITDSGTLADLPRFFEAMRQGEGIRYVVRP